MRVKPGSTKGDLVTQLDDRNLLVLLRQRPIDGKANEALIKVLAKHFAVRQNDVQIVSGIGSREKIVEIKIPA